MYFWLFQNVHLIFHLHIFVSKFSTAADTSSASSSTRQASAANNQSPSQDRLRQSGPRSQSKNNNNLYNYYHDQQPGTSGQPAGGHSNQRLSQPLTKDQDAGGSGAAAAANYPHSNSVPSANNNCDTPGKPMVVALNRTVSASLDSDAFLSLIGRSNLDAQATNPSFDSLNRP